MGISRIFDLSRRSMATYQHALDVTAHNVANSSNENYSRQRVVFSTETPETASGFVWGTGVKIETINRVRNSLIDAQLRTNNQSYYNNSKRAELLSQVEELYTEPTDLGISNLMSEFFNSWHDLAVTPNSSTLRTNVINAASQLSSKVTSITDGMEIIRSDIYNDAKSKVTQLNNDLSQLQSLNKQIFESESIGNTAGDLTDERDRILDELSTLVNITINYDNSNRAVVSIGGIFAADGTSATEFKLMETNGQIKIATKQSEVPVNLSGGDLKALTNIYSEDIPQYQQKLDSLMSSLVEAVNGEHSKGYSITNPTQTGINFFDSYVSGELTINSDILNDNRLIAVSADGTNGDGSIATIIGNISNEKLLDNTTLSDFYSNFISSMGADISKSTQSAESSELLVQQLQNQKASYSGVSVDEEMANVIKFQKSYEASAKMISVADEMLDTILNMV